MDKERPNPSKWSLLHWQRGLEGTINQTSTEVCETKASHETDHSTLSHSSDY